MCGALDIALLHADNFLVKLSQRKSPARSAGAEGGTAPETLRPTDRWDDDALESDFSLMRKIHRRTQLYVLSFWMRVGEHSQVN